MMLSLGLLFTARAWHKLIACRGASSIRGKFLGTKMAALFAVALACVSQAHAAVYDWSYSDYYHSGSGTLTTSGTGNPSLITALTGTFDGNSITFLAPGTCCNYPGNDNQLYADPGALLSGSGIAFQPVTEAQFQISYFDNGQTKYIAEDWNSVITYGTFTATAQITSLPGPTAVPEPASLSTFAAGLAALVYLFTRRRLATGEWTSN
jgi:hypothetical protein